MKCGRWPRIGAPCGVRAFARALSFGAVFAAMLTVATPISAQQVDPGGPGPIDRWPVVAATLACPVSTVGIETPGAERNRRIVAASYCAILKRSPDVDGLRYWAGQMDDGMTVSELIGILVNSSEFQARRTRNYSQTLAALRLGPTRLEQRRQLELRAAIVADLQPSPVIDAPPESDPPVDVESASASQPSPDDRPAAAEAVQVGGAALSGPEPEPVQQPQAEAERQAEAQRQAERWAEEERRIAEEKRATRLRIRNPITTIEFEAQVGTYGLDSTDPITGALIHGRLQGDRQPVNVAYVHLSGSRGMRVSPADRGRSTVGTWASEIGAHVAINGNWYAPYDGPAVSNGTVYGGEDHFYTALFGFTADGDLILDHHRETSVAVDDRVIEGVSGHPTLIYRGDRTTDFGGDPTFTSRQPRTAIGLDGSGDVLILVTVDGRSSSARGMTGDETAKLMERLGAVDAVMLDGGGSSTMWIAGRGIVNRPSGSLRAVGNQIAVFGN